MLKDKSKYSMCLNGKEYKYVLKSTLRHLKIPEPQNTCLQVDPRTIFNDTPKAWKASILEG